MARVKGKAMALAALMVTSMLASLVFTVSAEPREESPNYIAPVSADRFEAGWMDSTYSNTQNQPIDIRFYYPSGTSGANKPIDCAWAPYPWVAFHADSGEDYDAYSWLGNGLAKSGYFVVIIGEERGGDEEYRAITDHVQLTELIGYINLTGDQSRGPAGAQGCIDMDHWGISGHGRGAGLAMVVSSYWGAVFPTGQYQPPRALFGVGIDTDDIGTTVQASGLANPGHALFLTGTVDTVAPIDEHAEPLLQQWNGGWQLLEVVGANHVQYEDDQSFLDNLFDGDATITAEEQQQHAVNKIKPYLDLTLKGDDESWYAGSSRENDPTQPSDPNSYLSENLDGDQFYRMTLAETVTQAPNARTSPILFFNPLTNNTILATGNNQETSYNDMWTLDLEGSQEWEDAGLGPTSTVSNAFASDGGANGLMVGRNDQGNPTLWKWNGYSSTWTSYPENLRPNGSVRQSLVWDGGMNQYLSYGGMNETNEMKNETWAFNQNSAVWNQIQTTNSPRGIADTAMFFSQGWNRTILFGGLDDEGNMSNETWMFNGETNAWSILSLPGDLPSARAAMATAIDFENEVAYIFGGYVTDGVGQTYHLSNELWKLDLQQLSWEQLPSNGIDALWNAGMTVDNSSGNLVVFGGSTTDKISDKTWLYDIEEETWELHASSSAITSTDVIHISAAVSERDLETPPNSLEVHCQVVGETDWTNGSWDQTNDTATCDLSPYSLPPGFHTAKMRVRHEGQQASVQTTFQRANAPPQLMTPMPTFTLEEEGELTINASEIASDVDGHVLRFINNEFTFTAANISDPEPELDWTLRADRKHLWLSDLADWEGRTAESTYIICGKIRDESTPGNPPAQVPFCFEVYHQPIDDQFTVTQHPSFNLIEDQDSSEFDLTSYLVDQEGEIAVPWALASDSNFSEDALQVEILTDTNGETGIISVKPNQHWNGIAETSFCMLKQGLIEAQKHQNDCVWLNVIFTVDAEPDAPIFNVSQITLDEDNVHDVPLSEIVWDPDGDALNFTLESGETNITLELWHEQLRITPQDDWNGRAIDWAIVASDGEHTSRQPLRIIVEEIDDDTLVSWGTPADIIDNLTKLRVDINDVDNDGPWLIEYRWDNGTWKEITPSCAEELPNLFECQADILANELSFGDHKLNLRVNDGDSTSEISTYWVKKANPNGDGAAIIDSQSGLGGLAFIIGGIILLISGAAVIVTMLRRPE